MPVKNKLTVKAVDAKGPGRHGDGDGLWLQVKPSGSRSWLFQYTANGKERQLGLGPYPASTSGALHRPGTIVADGIEAELAATERQVRRDLRLDQLSNAWRDPPAAEAQAAPGPVTDREAAASARDARLQNAWKGDGA